MKLHYKTKEKALKELEKLKEEIHKLPLGEHTDFISWGNYGIQYFYQGPYGSFLKIYYLDMDKAWKTLCVIHSKEEIGKQYDGIYLKLKCIYY